MGRQSLLYNHIRRFRRSSIFHYHLSALSQNPNFFPSPSNPRSFSNHSRRFTPPLDPSILVSSNSIPFRSFSFHSSAGDPDRVDSNNVVKHSGTESESFDLGLVSSDVADGEDGGGRWYSPVRAVISLLDGAHDLTGLPWWAVISTSTLALRMALLPVLILQLKKLEKMSKLMPKLPPPLPPPLSGRSFRKQFLLFQKERRAIGCPSPLWSLASFFVQVPCFILWMASVRRMSLDHHPGFDMGGMLWFQNLTEFPHGALGLVFPISIAALHFINVQVSFKISAIRKSPGVIGLLAKGSLVYWLTNSSLNLVQQLSFKNPYFRRKVGLHPNYVSAEHEHEMPEGNLPPAEKLHPLSLKHPYILQKLGLPAKYVPGDHDSSTGNLPPDELLDLALQHLATGDQDRAFPLLRLAAEKDPELARASVAMGMLLFSRGLLTEAAEYFEHAISKIKDDDVTQLVIASFGAGVSLVSQPGRESEGIEHLKRIADLKEPENPTDKFCYFQGLVMLGSTLFNEGRKAEAAKYLRRAAAYDPAVNKYVEECERDEDVRSS
ncbi:ALBINO3-like protein 2, chloroplastic isoform X2 [Magnolia sinica]|uniref:ALBINO3-like protein 2, chloroplastic isoform X2 n=1 Tax=Magnolia sinica TaxID=86752 RepID=UPI002657D485|nr:ALBINO3-like protein 2, chloroplastic isoform X2 [Magnolia sinica]